MADFKLPGLKSDSRANQFERGADRHSTANSVRITVDLDPDLHRRLKIAAATEGRRIADLVRGWIDANTRPL